MKLIALDGRAGARPSPQMRNVGAVLRGASVNFIVLHFCAGLCQLRRLAKMARALAAASRLGLRPRPTRLLRDGRIPLPLRLMLRAVEPINMLRSARILSVGLRPTPRTLGKPQETCLHSGFGAAPQLKSPRRELVDCACVVRSQAEW